MSHFSRDLSFENMQYLGVDQMIEDIVTFGRYLQDTFSVTESVPNKIILWGSGAGATLAAWTKQRHPELIEAVWSSSGIFNFEIATSRKSMMKFITGCVSYRFIDTKFFANHSFRLL